MNGPRIGALFAGYGGLEMGVQSVLGGSVAWHSEIDPAPSKILAHHWPDVPNHGDITKVDWSAVEPVDVLTGGSPCQDVSAAGRRAGMRAGTRSGLWASMTDAIDALRPRLIVWENVRGVTSAAADSALADGSGLLGVPDGGTYLRALGRVLGDLADLGYDAQWHGLRAADIGAPHGRFRIFVAARDAKSGAWEPPQPSALRAASDRSAEPRESDCATPADSANVGHERRRPARFGWDGPTDRGGPTTDPDEPGSQGREPARGRLLPHGRAATDTESNPRRFSDRDSRPAAHASGARLWEHPGAAPTEETRTRTSYQPASADRTRPATNWGPYRPAIERWERILGRPAPAPTELAPEGGQRLSPQFVEWMMGLPAGHVTGVPGVSRNEQLKALGNGVVTQQAAAAVRHMLARESERAA